jgi:hypothetical protein
VSLGVIMTNTEIKFHILLFTLSSSSVSQSLLSLPQWKVFCSALQVVNDLIS